MHEVGLLNRTIAEAVAVAEQAGARRIERLTFALAPGGHVTVEQVETLVPVLAAGTLAEGAAVTVERRPGEIVCWSCGRTYAAADGSGCPACGSVALPTGQTPEIALVRVDVVE